MQNRAQFFSAINLCFFCMDAASLVQQGPRNCLLILIKKFKIQRQLGKSMGSFLDGGQRPYLQSVCQSSWWAGLSLNRRKMIEKGAPFEIWIFNIMQYYKAI